ncbi:MAG: triphosphoribosyl-dephospho-CoA synthase [Gammaproteobacteria bacterium]|nr:MAG: triphosphoribosyl-dephospho-CoA synthase [Gammaproteobacteria bacterium]
MLSSQEVAECIQWACEQEVAAPKPGNVNCFSGGHNMQVQDFLLSAKAIAPVLANPNLTVGELILQAIQATRTVVNCNTNLGIVLLFAPLCRAIHGCRTFEQLPEALSQILNTLTIDDAKSCYQAIRLADAGGLGKAEKHDIKTIPTINLKQAMALAQKHDTIAKQYLNNYHEIFYIGLPSLTSAINCEESIEWATGLAYLKILSSVPDTLVCRKQSREHASAVSKKAKDLVKKMNNIYRLSHLRNDIIAWDNELKKEAINPGTTADLTAATLLLYAFQSKLSSHRISVP